MRSLYLIFIFLICFWNLKSNAQSNNDLSIVPVINQAEYYINKIENDVYTISKLEFDLVFSSESTWSPIKLIGGKTYNILLFGEQNRIMDIDLKIYHMPADEWIVIKHENTSANILETTFIPEITAYYEFEIIAQSFFSGYSGGRYFYIVSF